MRAIPPQVFLSEISLPSITPSVEATGAWAKFFHPENDKGAICDLSHQNLAFFYETISPYIFFHMMCSMHNFGTILLFFATLILILSDAVVRTATTAQEEFWHICIPEV